MNSNQRLQNVQRLGDTREESMAVTNEGGLLRKKPLRLATTLVRCVVACAGLSLVACAGGAGEAGDEDDSSVETDGTSQAISATWCQTGGGSAVKNFRGAAYTTSGGVYVWFEAANPLGARSNTVTSVYNSYGQVVATISSPDNIPSYTRRYIHGRWPGYSLHIKMIFDKPNDSDPSCTIVIPG